MSSAFINKITFVCALVVMMVQSRKLSFRVLEVDHLDDISDERVIGLLGNYRNGRKAIDADSLAKAKLLYYAITQKLMRRDESLPPQVPEADTKNDDAHLVEQELKQAILKKQLALHEKPFVQHKGKNDFLVFKPGVQDPFVTVVPNDIYYNVEKRCVNWLDDCNERGIRNRLLHRVQSPYR